MYFWDSWRDLNHCSGAVFGGGKRRRRLQKKKIWGKFKPRRTQVVTGVFCGVKAIMSGMVLSHFSASSFGGCFWNLFAYCSVVGGLTSKDSTPLTWDLKQLCFFSSCHWPTSKSLYTTYINTHVTYIVCIYIYILIDYMCIYIYICILILYLLLKTWPPNSRHCLFLRQFL